jgi:hypothetical protein
MNGITPENADYMLQVLRERIPVLDVTVLVWASSRYVNFGNEDVAVC